ncbi:AAA family ATPase [Edaphobacter modestus]|uniref:DNA sulfur modification protein DndD n=1 Tax=Edaphobacter modestus TaxID=388466 RepID=A0A4Q7Y3M7_9BACT|nr:AAA family ATPase [Edaphobacter modestus]RZU30369.1 DNA sulfur modification protein DndD [Edaphobacter modestus]
MLSIRSIRLANFGPFKGEQRIEVPAASGVSIIYGENMRGKTTLLNAIRYALFGKVITRGASQMALHQIGNWEAAKDGIYGFKVVLEFEHEASSYELTREHRPRAGIAVPQSDIDYQQDCFLRKNGDVLSPDARDAAIARIMPETVSRFFLFDGELLQQYEELLHNESDMGRSIKEAIERILGVPVLTNGRLDLTELAKDAQKREAKAAQKNQKTQTLGNQHEALLVQRDGQQQEVDRLKGEMESLRLNKAALEDQMRKTQRTKGLLDDRQRLEDAITVAEAKLREKEDRRKELLTMAWKGLLTGRIAQIRVALEQDLRALRDRYQRAVISSDVVGKLREALKAGECSTCGNDLSAAASERLAKLIADGETNEDHVLLEAGIQELDRRITALKQSEAGSGVEVLQEIQNAIDDLRIEKASAEDSLADIREQTKDLDETEVRRLYSDFEKTVSELTILQLGVKKQEEALRTANDNISKVEAEMAKFSDIDLGTERARKEMCESLRTLFAAAVDAYRERLRARVERDATSLFVKLTSEPEYTALSINDSYGLTIVHEDGSQIPVRSAGAEHIVALSLMGALQRNAPLSGPIVMDSPFGRLDDVHTTKVVQALSSMADQVMLLVYESELNPTQARNQLQGSLRKEYRIARLTARHSELQSIV